MKKLFFLLLCSVLLFFALYTRLYKLGSAPNSLIIDEAHYAYIAYSMLMTGKDEHGLNHPLVFKGFGDYKLPALVYSLVPVVKFFGLNNFAARLPSALAGVLLIFVVYLLFREWKFSKKASAFAGLLTLISPWTFILSRFAYEANLGLLFFALAILFIFKASNKNKAIFFVLSAIFFALTVYSYVIYKLIAVFFVFFFCLYFFFFSKKNKFKAVLFATLFFLLVAPFFVSGLTGNSNFARFKQVGIFSDLQIITQIDENRHFCLQEYPKTLCYSFFNKPTAYLRMLFDALVKTYSPEYLFIKGDENLLYMNVSSTGLFNLFLLPFYLLGFFVFMVKLFNKQSDKLLLIFLLLGLLIAPLPGILSGVQKVRISALFIFILPFFAFAYQFVLEKIKKKQQKNVFSLLLVVLTFASFIIYFINFISVHTVKKDYYYDSYARGIFAFTDQYLSQNEVDEVVIQPFFSDPIMYYAFYQQVDPRFYQAEVILNEAEGSGFQHALALGKYRVAKNEEPNTLACNAHQQGRKVLYVDNNWKSKLHILKIVKSNFEVLDYAFIIDLSSFGKELTALGKCK